MSPTQNKTTALKELVNKSLLDCNDDDYDRLVQLRSPAQSIDQNLLLALRQPPSTPTFSTTFKRPQSGMFHPSTSPSLSTFKYNLSHLRMNIWHEIIGNLDAQALISLSCACKQFRQLTLTESNEHWYDLAMRDYPRLVSTLGYQLYDLENCRSASIIEDLSPDEKEFYMGDNWYLNYSIFARYWEVTGVYYSASGGTSKVSIIRLDYSGSEGLGLVATQIFGDRKGEIMFEVMDEDVSLRVDHGEVWYESSVHLYDRRFSCNILSSTISLIDAQSFELEIAVCENHVKGITMIEFEYQKISEDHVETIIRDHNSRQKLMNI